MVGFGSIYIYMYIYEYESIVMFQYGRSCQIWDIASWSPGSLSFFLLHP